VVAALTTAAVENPSSAARPSLSRRREGCKGRRVLIGREADRWFPRRHVEPLHMELLVEPQVIGGEPRQLVGAPDTVRISALALLEARAGADVRVPAGGPPPLRPLARRPRERPGDERVLDGSAVRGTRFTTVAMVARAVSVSIPPSCRDKEPSTLGTATARQSVWYQSPVVQTRPPAGRTSIGSSPSKTDRRRWSSMHDVLERVRAGLRPSLWCGPVRRGRGRRLSAGTGGPGRSPVSVDLGRRGQPAG
jgi:hypothetical protein